MVGNECKSPCQVSSAVALCFLLWVGRGPLDVWWARVEGLERPAAGQTAEARSPTLRWHLWALLGHLLLLPRDVNASEPRVNTGVFQHPSFSARLTAIQGHSLPSPPVRLFVPREMPRPGLRSLGRSRATEMPHASSGTFATCDKLNNHGAYPSPISEQQYRR